MNLTQKIRDSIAKYDNPRCAEVLFRQKNYRPNCPPYGRTNYSDTCVVENNCTPNYCPDPRSDKYCERVTSECSLRSPTGSLHKMRYSAMNCSPPCRKPCPSPCCHSPYQAPIKPRCGPSYCRPRYSRCIDPCIDRYCNPCDGRFPRVCDSIILTKSRISRTRLGRHCGPRCSPCPPFRSPCGSPRCKKPPCSYRYPRNCVKPRVCCDGSPPCTPSCSPSMRCPSPSVPPLCDPCKPRRCASPCRPTKCCPKPPRCLPDPCGPCLPKRPQYCGPKSRCPPPCDSFKYPCFYYDKSCNNLCVKMVDGSAIRNSQSRCCKPLTSLFCSGSGTMFSISPCDRDKCCGDYNFRINNLRSLSNIRSAIFNDCNDRCRPGNRYPSPCPPGRAECPPRGLSGSCRPCSAPGSGAYRPCRDPCGPYRPGRDPCEPCRPGTDPCGPCGPRSDACSPCEPGRNACGPCGPSRDPCEPYRPGRDPCEPCRPGIDPCGPCKPGRDPCEPCGPSSDACSPCEPGRDACGPCGPYRPGRDTCGPCGPNSGACGLLRPGRGACGPCSPKSRPYQRDLDCYGYDSCEPCPPRRPCTRVKSLCLNDCNYGSRRSCSDSYGRPKTCPTPITPECITSCRCSGCTMFGPSYCVQRSNSRVPCLCAKYPCLPKFC